MTPQQWFAACASEYERQSAGGPFPLDTSEIRGCDDRRGGASIDAQYAHADLWAARGILDPGREDPYGRWVPSIEHHIDVGSRLDGLVTHLLASATMYVTHVDIRPPAFKWPGLRYRADDARYLASFGDAISHSVSCVHAAEHVGLGRYGDKIDADGMAKCMRSLARILAPGGALFFACPVGRQRVVFNAHRVASPSWVASIFESAGLALDRFAAVDDAGAWHDPANPADYERAEYACGCWVWRKP